MTGSKKRAGDRGEELAVRRLKKDGYRIVERNWHCRYGEIDIVALDGRVLAFVEVKARSAGSLGTAFDAVDGRKRARLIRSANEYISKKNPGDAMMRFDVVGVSLDSTPPAVEVLKNAFDLGCGWE